VFHGPGVPYLHFLPFVVFGGDFVASELSRQFVSIVAAIGVLIAFFRVWTGNWHAAVPLSVVALATLIPLRVNALVFPINSMIGLRSTVPIIIGIHLLLRPTGRRAVFERGGLFALALMFGIEQGIAAIAGFALLQILIALRTRTSREPLNGVVSIVAGIALYAALIFLMTPSGFSSVMRFNFREVPADQMWYFGASPNEFFYRWIHLFRFLDHPIWTGMAIFALIYAVVRYWRAPHGEDRHMRVAEAFLMLYALVTPASMLGTFSTVYFQPAVRVSLFILLMALRRWWLARRDTLNVPPELRRRLPIYATGVLVGYTAIGFTLATIAIFRTPLHMAYAHVWLGEPPVMSRDWQITERVGAEVLRAQQAALNRKPVLWSTYSSYVESQNDLFNPSFDYIIHALGHDNRELYARTFVEKKPDVVQTLRPTYTAYEEWLAIHHWNFYRPLLRDYRLAAGGPWSYFWTRAPQPLDEKATAIVHSAVPQGTLGIAIDGNSVHRDSLGLFEVRLFYHVKNPWKRIPVLGTLPRYMVLVGGASNRLPVSLPPYETEKRFPVIAVGPNKNIRLLGQVYSIVGGVELVFDSVHVERLSLSPANNRWARDFIVGPPVPTLDMGQPADSTR
jgi:hypothetical protein